MSKDRLQGAVDSASAFEAQPPVAGVPIAWSCEALSVNLEPGAYRFNLRVDDGNVTVDRFVSEIDPKQAPDRFIASSKNHPDAYGQHHMLQDISRPLSRALESKPDSMMHAREAAAKLADEKLREDALNAYAGTTLECHYKSYRDGWDACRKAYGLWRAACDRQGADAATRDHSMVTPKLS